MTTRRTMAGGELRQRVRPGMSKDEVREILGPSDMEYRDHPREDWDEVWWYRGRGKDPAAKIRRRRMPLTRVPDDVTIQLERGRVHSVDMWWESLGEGTPRYRLIHY